MLHRFCIGSALFLLFLLWFYVGAALVLHCSCIGFALTLQWFCIGSALLLHLFYIGSALVLHYMAATKVFDTFYSTSSEVLLNYPLPLPSLLSLLRRPPHTIRVRSNDRADAEQQMDKLGGDVIDESRCYISAHGFIGKLISTI